MIQQRVADDELREPERQQRQQPADPVDEQAEHEAPLAAPDVGQLAARDHQRRHREGEQRDRGLHPATEVSRSPAIALMATFMLVAA
jgi:hypothetical protein